MYQKVVIVGNLGTDPEMRYTPSGTAVTNFNVATNRRWTDGQGNQQEETVWFRVSTWGRMAETCNQYLSKGRQVMVEGRLRPDPETGGPRVWTDQNGQPRASFELNAMEVKFLGTRGDSGGYSDTADETQEAPGIAEDEIPF
jgi:single-strand DNA-binding protein